MLNNSSPYSLKEDESLSTLPGGSLRITIEVYQGCAPSQARSKAVAVLKSSFWSAPAFILESWGLPLLSSKCASPTAEQAIN